MKTIDVQIKGLKPLLQHNEQLANPLSESSQKLAEVSKKRNKTLDDHRLLSKLEFKGGIYHDEEAGVFVPNTWLLKCIERGATKMKLGKAMRSAIIIAADKIPLEFDGPQTIEALYAEGFYDQRCVKIGTSKTVRTRPRFNDWRLKFQIEYDETLIDASSVKAAIERGGKVEGLGDYRPRFGTFYLEAFNG